MTTTPRFLAVVNPAAGGGACGRHAVATIERLRRGCNTRFYFSLLPTVRRLLVP